MGTFKPFYIGIDGGGTKTAAALCDDQGHILATVIGESSNIQSRSWRDVETTLRDLIHDLLTQVKADSEQVAGLVFGLAGADRPEARQLIADAFYPHYSGIGIDNDAVTALFTGTWGQPGIVLIAGTGSIAYGISSKGQRFRVGGWGYLLGDEGSGFDLGKQAINAVMRQFDGRGQETMLTPLVLDYYGMEDASQLIHVMYHSDNPRKRIAEAGRLLVQAAEQKDPVAEQIMDDAAEHLCEMVVVCKSKMGEDVPVVLAGGAFSSERFTRLVQERLFSVAEEILVPRLSPVVGALCLALKNGGVNINQRMVENLSCMKLV